MTNVAPAHPAPSGARIRTLAPTADLLERLHREGVRYCVWKGTANLSRVLAGEKDLDLLVDPGELGRFRAALRDAGFRAVRPAPGRDEPGTAHFFALDGGSGRVAHLHLHHELVLTRANPRGYRLPWREVLLATRRFDAEAGVWVVAPAAELVLFAVRAALALSPLDRLRAPGGCPLPAPRAAEFRRLADRAGEAELLRAAEVLVGAGAAPLVLQLAADGPRRGLLRRLLRRMRPAPAELAAYGALPALRRSLAARRDQVEGALRRRLGIPAATPRRRTPVRGGRMIAVLGVDGSGKSTVAGEVARWLAPVVDVLPVYLGGGRAATSLPRRLLRAVHGARKRLRRAPRGPSPYPHPGQGAVHEDAAGPAALLRKLWFAAWTLSLASARLRSVKRARRACARGMVVVSDRYPQLQVAGMNDGPLLERWLDHRSPLLRAFARRERARFRAATATAPDLVVMLSVDTDTALARRPATDPGLLARKAAAVESLVFPADTRVVKVDANRQLDDVLADVRAAVWEEI